MSALTFEETFQGLLALLVGAALLGIIIYAAMGGLPQLSNIFQNLGLPFQNIDIFQPDADYYVANSSFTALTCAINSVGTTEELSCLRQFEDPKNTSVECDFSYPQFQYEEDNAISKTSDVWYWFDGVEWKWKSPDEGFRTYKQLGDRDYDQKLIPNVDDVYRLLFVRLNKVKNDYGKGVQVLEDTVNENSDDWIRIHYPSGEYKDTPDGVQIDDLHSRAALEGGTCTVKKFNLPQLVTDAVAYIPDYGDPKFLLYWEVFPEDADRWSFKLDKKILIGIVIITAIPPVKAAKVVFKGLTSIVVKDVSKVVAKELVEKAAREAAEAALKKAGRELTEEAIKQSMEAAARRSAIEVLERTGAEVTEEAIQKTIKEIEGSVVENQARAVTKQAAMRYILKNSLIEIAKERIKHPIKAIKTGAVLTGVAAAAAWADSKIGRTTVHPGNMVLKVVLEPEGETLPIDVNVARYPVILHWDPGVEGVGYRTHVAHFASPCYLENLKVRKGTVDCDRYTYNTDTGLVACEDPGIDYDIDDECGILNYMRIGETVEEKNVLNDYINEMDVIKATKETDLVNKYIEMEGSIDGFEYDYVPGDVDAKPDSIEIEYDGNDLTLIDSDDDGFYETYATEDCQIEAIILEYEQDDQVKGDDEYNYCNDQEGSWPTVLSWAGIGVAVAGVVVAGFFTGGVAWAIGITATVAGASLEIAGIETEYKEYWPGTSG